MNDINYQRLMKSGKWRTIRMRYLQKHPLCEDCLACDRTTIATEVHHVVPIGTETGYDGMRRLAYDVGNLRALCHDCHERTHEELESRTRSAVARRTRIQVEQFCAQWLSERGGD